MAYQGFLFLFLGDSRRARYPAYVVNDIICGTVPLGWANTDGFWLLPVSAVIERIITRDSILESIATLG